MPIKLALQNINGKKHKELIPDDGILNEILPFDDRRYPLLGWVDPYSNTIFNSNQMHLVIEELDLLAQEVDTKEGKELLFQIRDLAEKCRHSPQTYLRFIGD
jgi:hypothetical protein